MGRQRKENPMTATGRSRKRCSDPDKCLAANKKKREARQLKAQTNPLSEEELKKKRIRIRKASSRLNQSRQKEVGTRLKDRNGDYKNCECLEQFKEYPKNIRMTTHNFTVSAKKKKDANDENDDLIDLDEDEANEWEEMHIETEASKYIEEGDFAVINTGPIKCIIKLVEILCN